MILFPSTGLGIVYKKKNVSVLSIIANERIVCITARNKKRPYIQLLTIVTNVATNYFDYRVNR